ncbi:hypothetical protein J6590_011201, partial [Homalodisca vitripennis]
RQPYICSGKLNLEREKLIGAERGCNETLSETKLSSAEVGRSGLPLNKRFQLAPSL